MFRCRWYKGVLHRKIVSLVLFSYFMMIFLFLMHLDIIQTNSKSGDSTPRVLDDVPQAESNTVKEGINMFSLLRKLSLTKSDVLQNAQNDTAAFERNKQFLVTEMPSISHPEPPQLVRPMLDLKHEMAGDFIVIGKEAYVYSAFVDDRKIPSFVRIMSLLSKTASYQPMYCLFNKTTDAQPQQATRYELCENHDRPFGGYVYSCRVPQYADVGKLGFVTISFEKLGSNVPIPLQSVRPPKHKITRLDLFPNRTNANDTVQVGQNYKSNREQEYNSLSNNTGDEAMSQKSFTFAICISPLFGNISVHRLVEFIELSRLLGAEHFIFYNHSVTPEISAVLQFYIGKKLASVQAWTLPPHIHNDSDMFIWYLGQLLAHNDCLYRSMPRFDLVAFNDIDEFIVPHSNASNWQEVFPRLLADDRCGFSLQSAFYDPGSKDPFSRDLLTPILTEKTQLFSTVR